MLPKVREDGRPFVPSWLYSVVGWGCFFVALLSVDRSQIKLVVPAVGSVLLIMGLAIETAILRARVERLENEHEALRHSQGDDFSRRV